MANIPNAKEVGAFQKLISQNPVAFTATIFFLMFGITYFINIEKSNDAEIYWKELYQAEKNRTDALTTQLLMKAGVIEKQNEVIIKADSTLKDNVSEKVQKILSNEINK